jgi:hypothetical protein
MSMLNLSSALQKLSAILMQNSILEAARFKASHFTRNRKMTFSQIVLFILSGFKTSTQTALHRFYADVLDKEGCAMTQQALSKARSHFDHSPFEFFFRDLVQMRFSGEHEIRLFHNFQIFAVDGSDLALPGIPKLLEDFGGTGRNADSPTAKISILYDILNDFVVDAAIDRISTSERDFALAHIKKLKNIVPNTEKILIFDRGYPSAALIQELKQQNLHFLMRVKSKWNSDVDEVTAADSSIHLNEATALRVIKFKLPSGETETLITYLFELPFEEFPKLYFKRWPIETKYDVVKNKFLLENFTGYTKNVILQDFWATMYLTNVAAVAKEEANAEVQKERQGRDNKYEYAPNLNQVIATLKDYLARACFTKSAEERETCLNFIMLAIKRSLVPIRPHRTVKRPLSPRKARFHHNRKYSF